MSALSHEVLSIAVCQMTSVDCIDTNLKQIENLLSQIQAGTQIVFFPENCLFMRIREGEKISGIDLSDPAFVVLQKIADQKQVYLHLGSVPLKKDNKLTNASVLVSPNAPVECTYEKMHLFDIELTGQAPIRESDVFVHGEGPRVLDIAGWKIGQSICYDIRFADLYSYYAKQEVDLIIVPAAFLVKTGQAHWETLLRARAIENQCYVLAAAQAGVHRGAKLESAQSSRETFGNSLIIDPWGQIAKQALSAGPELLSFVLEKAKNQAVRRQIPMRHHRRPV